MYAGRWLATRFVCGQEYHVPGGRHVQQSMQYYTPIVIGVP